MTCASTQEPGQLLALAGAVIGLVAAAHVDRAQLPAPAALVAHRHLVAAPAAGDQPGQQGRAVAHRAQALGTGPVSIQSLHVPLVLLDADIGRQHPGQVDQPAIPPDPDPARARPPRLAPPGIQCAAAIGVNTSVGRVAQHVRHPGAAGTAPGQLPALGPFPLPDSQLDAVIREKPQHGAHRAQPLEQAEDQAYHGAHLLIRIQHHFTGQTAHQPGRQRHRQLAAAGLGDPPGPHPLLDQMQLSLADGALQAQQQPVVVLGRVINAVQVAQQRPGQRAQLQQLMPLPARPGQPGHLDAQHDPHMIQPYLGDQPREARTRVGAGGRMPQVLIDHQHPRRRPPQRDRALGQPVLQPRGLGVIGHLSRGGLADIDRRQAVTMPGLDLALRPLPGQPRRDAHRAHPRSRPSRAPSARPAGPADDPRAPGRPPGTTPMPARSPAPAGSRGHSSISRHRSPPSSAPARTSRSRRTSATTASRPSIPRTAGGSPRLDTPMYAVWLAP